MRNIKKLIHPHRLLGPWRLLDSTQSFADGKVNRVFGTNPAGYIIFTEQGIMSVHIMRRERKDFNGEHLLHDYLAYSGRFYIDAQEEIITIHVETSLSSEYLGKEIKRRYTLDNNRLTLKVLESEVEYNVVWERIV